MPQDYTRQLSNFFINRSLQLKLVFISLSYMAIMLAVTLSFTLLPVIHTMFGTTDPNVQYKSAQTFLLLAQRLVPSVLLLFGLFFIHLIIMTHRICGPLVNFNHTFECMAEGDFSRRITLRRKDYLHDEAEVINEALDNLHDHIAAIQEENHTLDEVLLKAENAPTPEALANVRAQSNKLSDLVNAFHLERT
jgi:methyl-accepting chemotaxis protein